MRREVFHGPWGRGESRQAADVASQGFLLRADPREAVTALGEADGGCHSFEGGRGWVASSS